MKKTAIVLSVILILLVLFYLTPKNGGNYYKEILKKPMFSNGTFVDFKYEKGKPIIGVYSFQVNNLFYQSHNADGRYRKLQHELIGKKFPVIYNVDDPNLNYILVFPSDFEAFNLGYPDSLK